MFNWEKLVAYRPLWILACLKHPRVCKYYFSLVKPSFPRWMGHYLPRDAYYFPFLPLPSWFSKSSLPIYFLFQ